MQTLRDANPQHRGFSHVPLFIDSFETESRFGQHTCIVAELLGAHLPGLMESFENRRAPEGFAKVVIEGSSTCVGIFSRTSAYNPRRYYFLHLTNFQRPLSVVLIDVKLSNLMSVIAGIKPEVFDDAQKE